MRTNNKHDKVKHFTKNELALFFRALEKEKRRKENGTLAYRNAVRDEAMFKIIYYCALRASELSNLTLASYDENRNDIYCERLKGGKDNTLHIVDQDVQESLKLHLEVNEPKFFLFETRSGNCINRKTVFVLMRKYCQKAGIMNISKCHPHTLRHTRAVDMLDMGCSVYDVQFWLGHVDFQNTEIYLKFTTNQQEQLYHKLSFGQKNSKKGSVARFDSNPRGNIHQIRAV